MSSTLHQSEDALKEYSIQELGQMLFDVKIRLSNNEKKMMSNRFDQEAFSRQQAMVNKSLEDHLSKLLIAVENLGSTHPQPAASTTASRGWTIPASVVSKPPTFDPDSWPKLKFDPPRFAGDNVVRWIKRIQKYYNHSFTPLADRLYLTEFLLDGAAAEWFGYWEDNNDGKSWDEFLLAAKLRFDPDLYEDYVGRLATLRQDGSLDDYLKAFEPVLQKVGNVGDSTLTSLFIAGLSPSLNTELLTRRPASLSDAMALAQQLSACHSAASIGIPAPTPSWDSRDIKQTAKYTPPHSRPTGNPRPAPTSGRNVREGPPRDFPIVRVSAAEKAEKAKRGECFYCPEKYSRTHVCNKKFYALMGEDDVEELPEPHDDSESEDEANTMVITGDVSTIHVIGPKLRPRAIRLTGHIHGSPISVLIDGGSTHNFIKPAVAEKLSLPLHSVTPFRVFVGNGESLRCKYACLSTPISLQGHMFAIDLFILQVEGPDIILGVQWLQDLGEVTKNYRTLSMQFKWEDRPIVLQGEDKPPQPISYRRFVRHYSLIAAPLTELLKKDSFSWSEAAIQSFDELKKAMSSTPVLHLPDFSSKFVVETDASDFGIGAVLLQNGHPLAYFSKKLGPRRRLASTYHKELYAIVEAVHKWRQYLLGQEFIIRSDQRSLKELLSQVIQTPDQQFYVRKLMGFKFSIEYKAGASNKVADALSRRDEGELFALFAQPVPDVMRVILKENSTLPDLCKLHEALKRESAPAHVSEHGGLLYYKTRIYLSHASTVRLQILDECHSSHAAGHPGEKRTFTRVASSFYWPGMRRDVRDFVASCFVCQSTKYSRSKPHGLIQPLPIPNMVWESASMDFIVGLPPSHGYTAIMVVVDRLSKYAHFGVLRPGFDAKRVARLFVDTVVRLHGFPAKLLSDRDPIFMSDFWEELLLLSGTKLQFTTAYHPQTDGQSEVTNRGLEQYLRAFTHDRPARWFDLMPWAELALNCSTNESIGMSPFEALYGRPPPNIFQTYSRPSHNQSVAELLEERHATLQLLKDRIARAQRHMAEFANRHRKDMEFCVGDRVLLRLQPYRQTSVGKPLSTKLGRRFYGPYEITERIGKVAYRLRLPIDSRIHDVFHVSLLRPFVKSIDTSVELPAEFRRHKPLDIPVRATDSRTVLVDKIPQEQWLVSWSSAKAASPTWEPAAVLRANFPHLHLEDKANTMGGGIDTDQVQQDEVEEVQAKEAGEQAQNLRNSSPVREEPEPSNIKGQSKKKKARPTRKKSRPIKFKDYNLD